MNQLASYGLINTFAGTVSQLFPFTLVFSAVRLAQPHSRNSDEWRAYLLIFASLSYVFYILAYVGRDGIVYWIMTLILVYTLFFPYLSKTRRRRILSIGIVGAGFMAIPLLMITISRFANSDHGSAWSIVEYFGLQINTFSDYFSIDRPITFGAANFSMIPDFLCNISGSPCVKWDNVKPDVFEIYLNQGVQPWLFATFVSDLAGDFGYVGTIILLIFYSLFCRKIACDSKKGKSMTMSRLLLVFFLFLIPFWGLFYFRYSIANFAIITNLLFIFLTSLMNRSTYQARKIYPIQIR